MTTTIAENPEQELVGTYTKPVSRIHRLQILGFGRELLVILAFCLFTAALTWPYVAHLKNAVVDEGDPYLIAWILWWDYHATFTDPLNLFHANVFYPLKYTLAFSENSYGIALLFFPLYALGLKPLTVHAVALFFGFVLSGYGAFRLARTLTGCAAVGWVAGIIFAFVPYRFHLMSQVAYVFSPWMPLLFEALVLFMRKRSFGRTAWLGFAFFMSGLTALTWFTFSLIPFLTFAAILATRYNLWRDRAVWVRGAVALGVASLFLLPVFVPYLIASRLYGFKRSIEEVKRESAEPIHWLSVEVRNRFWRGMGDAIDGGYRFKLFPGLLPILFSVVAIVFRGDPKQREVVEMSNIDRQTRWIRRLNVLIFAFFALSIPAFGFDRSDRFYKIFKYLTSEGVTSVLALLIIVRLCFRYPRFLRTSHANLIETIHSSRSDAFWLGSLLTIVGFCFSLGWNSFLYRICYDLIPMFKSIRGASRGAMLAYLGLALLAGLGVNRIARLVTDKRPQFRGAVVTVVACALLLVELNAAPLGIVGGEASPDAITLRLKQTPMHGGIVLLPAGGMNNYRYMLRAADHAKPLIVGTSGFNSPIEDQIEQLIRSGPIPPELLDLIERVPTSYLVITNDAITPDRKTDYEVFLAQGLLSGRLRFINRFDGRDDLYAIVKNEPQSIAEAPAPFPLSDREWASKVGEDPVHMFGHPLKLSQRLYRLHLLTFGTLPRFNAFRNDLQIVLQGILIGSSNEEQLFESQFQKFVKDWTKREPFASKFGRLPAQDYVNQLIANGGLSIDSNEAQSLMGHLSDPEMGRSRVLLELVDHPRLVDKEKNRSMLTLCYFGFLQRNPDDPPDRDLRGFNYWLQQLERGGDVEKLPIAFHESSEYQQLKKETPHD